MRNNIEQETWVKNIEKRIVQKGVKNKKFKIFLNKIYNTPFTVKLLFHKMELF